MQTDVHGAECYDFRQHDQIWRRVGPQLEPYPEQTAAPEEQEAAGVMTPRQEENLPGAIPDPCCMGSAAQSLIEVLDAYIEQELEDQRIYRALAQTAPAWARSGLRQISADEGGHARRLMAVHYLITGTCYRSAIRTGCVQLGCWCAALRHRYHEEACGALNYGRTADDTTDPCLSKLLLELSADEHRHADALLAMLERSLRQSC